MTPWQRGAVVSTVFGGILLGNMACGPLGDQFGRRIPVLISYAGIVIFSVLSACSQSWFQLTVVRLFVGAAFGIGQPACSTLCSEVTPTFWRITVQSITSMLFVFGEMYSALLVWWDDPLMQDLDWRWLLLMGAIPSLIFSGLALFFLHDSPSHLAVAGEHEKAKLVLESMRGDNRAYGVNVDFKRIHAKKLNTSPVQVILDPLQIIFSWKMLFSTMVVIYSCFTLNVLFYGCLYAFPQVVTDVDMGTSPAVSLIIGAIWELPGNVIAAVAGMFCPRKPLMAAYLGFTMVSLVFFTTGAAGSQGSWLYFMLLQSGYIGIKSFVVIGFVAVYQYATEIYPTVARTTGTAACVAGGRLGGIVAPLIFEWQLGVTGSFMAFFYFMAGLCALNFVLVLFLPVETFGKSLEDDMDETQPLRAQAQVQ